MSNVDCYICNQPGTKESNLSECIGPELYEALQDPCESDPLTGTLRLKEVAATGHDAEELRKQLISRGCGNRFHQPCEKRHKSASYDHKYVDASKDANGELQYQTRDLTHRLCS